MFFPMAGRSEHPTYRSPGFALPAGPTMIVTRSLAETSKRLRVDPHLYERPDRSSDMADSLDEIEAALSDAIDITDDERADERLEAAREELRDLRETGEVDEERADELETRIDQRLRGVEERENYEVDAMGAARSPDDENA